MATEPTGYYRNNKNGKLYVVLNTATHSEQMYQLVIYKCVEANPGEPDHAWARPLDLFIEKFTSVPNPQA